MSRPLGPRTWSATHPGHVRDYQEDRLLVTHDLIAVADGMGGMVSGGWAADQVVLRLATERGSIKAAVDLARIIREADGIVARRYNGRSGSTAVVAWLTPTGIDIANAGDSRAYWWKKARGTIVQVTTDHASGPSTLTNSVGSGHTYVDLHHIEPAPGDMIVLCSDGLTDQTPDYTISRVIDEHRRSPAKALVDHVLTKTQARDNVSVIVHRVGPR